MAAVDTGARASGGTRQVLGDEVGLGVPSVGVAGEGLGAAGEGGVASKPLSVMVSSVPFGTSRISKVTSVVGSFERSASGYHDSDRKRFA